MGRSQETFGKKEVRDKKAKKRKEKEAKRQAKREQDKSSKSLDDMIAYVDEFGNFTSTPPDLQEREEIDPESIEITVSKKEHVEEDPNRTGIVTFFNHDKGYGFIKDSLSHESIFVHINNAEEEITENNKVSFEVEPGMKGPTAVRVKIVR